MEQAKAATAKRAYKRKTRDIYIIQQYTGPQYGWEDLCEEDEWREAYWRKKEYQENQPEYPVRIVKKRERIEEA